ncbi:hypothetical protein [Rhizobium sp. P38BS-XIX]|uniref:YncE family protein n=1 Tax=Rhizobium sp. P38BS-XIX TaxID=2726740 RepID=UPI00197CB9AC|nr:hypothetical protein [Rhizobium sp. P38BS-XIX]
MPEDFANDRLLMLIEKSSHCLSFYHVDSGRLVDSVALPEFPHEFVVDSERRHAYVGHYGVRTSSSTEAGGSSIFVIDIANRRLERRIDCKPYHRLHGMGIDRFDRLYALSETAGVLLQFDTPLTDEVPTRAVASGGLKSHLFALSRDGQWAYCMNLLSHTVTKVAPQNAVVAPIAVSPGEKPEGILLSSDEKTLYISNRISRTIVAIDTETMEIKRRAPSRPDPARIYAMPDNRLLVVNYEGRSASVIDSETLEELAFTDLPGRPAAGCIDANANVAFVSIDTNVSLQLDLKTLEIIKSFQTRNEPDCCFLLNQS